MAAVPLTFPLGTGMPPAPVAAKLLKAPKIYPFLVEDCTDGALKEWECKECHVVFEAYTSPSSTYCEKHYRMENQKAQPITPNAAALTPPAMGSTPITPAGAATTVHGGDGNVMVMPDIVTALEHVSMGFVALAKAQENVNTIRLQEAAINTAAIAKLEERIGILEGLVQTRPLYQPAPDIIPQGTIETSTAEPEKPAKKAKKDKAE